MGVAERRAREKAELRDKIVSAATELFVSEGFENVTIRRIADKIEYSPATIYLYFQDKAELCGTICAETFDHLREELEAIQAETKDPEQGLRKSFRAYIEFGLEHPHHYIFTLCLPEPPPSDDLPEPVKGMIMVPGMRAFDNLRQGLSAAMDHGILRRQDVELAAQIAWSMMHGLTALLVTARSFPFLEKERLIDHMIESMMRSLR